jgi:hypothetical protein
MKSNFAREIGGVLEKFKARFDPSFIFYRRGQASGMDSAWR